MGSFKAIKENEKEYSHIILESDEYSSLIQKINIESYKNDMLEKKFKEELQNIQKLKNEQISENEKSIAALTEQLKHQKELNDNLLRISKERANAKRGLKPKKERSGFIALSLEQYVYVMKSFGNTKDIPCWKVKIQTPYDSSLEYSKVQALMKDNNQYLLGQCLRVNNLWSNNKIKETYVSDIDELFKDKTIVFNTKFRANIKQGFWEVDYLVNKIVTIPEELRA